MSDPQFCRHYEHAHVFSHEGTHCDNCGKQLTILETLDPSEHWTPANAGPSPTTEKETSPLNTFRDNGGKLPAGLAPIKNHTGHSILISPYPQEQKREPIVTLRSGMTYYRDGFGYKWNWTCRLCSRTSGAAYWDLAYESATHHARNHHGR